MQPLQPSSVTPTSGSSVPTVPLSARPDSTKLFFRVATLVAIWQFSIVVAVFSSSLGRYSVPITSGDWAQHMALVEVDFHNAQPSSAKPSWDAGFMTGYPGWSHAVVAYTAVALDLDPLRSMQIWTAVFLITGCFIMAARMAFHADHPPSFLGIVATSAFLAACAYSGLALRGHIERNYFFPQLAGTVIAIAALAMLQHLEWDVLAASLFIIVLGGIVLPNFHLLPAVWFTLAGLIFIFLGTNHWRLAMAQCALIGMAALFLWFRTGGVMLKSSDTNGWFLLSFTQLSDHGVSLAIALGLVFCALILVSFYHLRRGSLDLNRWRLADVAGLIAVCLLIVLQAFIYLVFHKGTVYSVTKYLYLLGTELAVLLIRMRRAVFSHLDTLLQRHPQRLGIGCFAILFLSQGPFLSTPYDQRTLIGIRGRLLALQPSGVHEPRSYPQFASLDYDRNYYLAIAVMRIPPDERTDRWLSRGTTGETPFVWPDPASAEVPIPNSDFESGTLTPWLQYLSAEPAVTGQYVHRGRFALAEGSGVGSVYQDVTGLVPGREYTLIAYVAGSPEGTAKAQLALWEEDNGHLIESPLVTPGPAWQVITQSFVAGSSGRMRLHLIRQPGKGLIYWDDSRLVASQ
jgi:hypothetical protein